MKINLNDIDRTQFMVHPHIVAGEPVFLIQPQFIGVKWTQDNKHFRSSVWDKDGYLISAGFPKFTNWGENPENFPTPTSIDKCQLIEKLDGSLLIVSYWRNNLIVRTRGTIDAMRMDNGDEIEVFKNRYPLVFTQDEESLKLFGESETWPASYLYEWTSPRQRIVIDYGSEPDIRMVGIVRHEDYSLVEQYVLDRVAEFQGVKRPRSFHFNSIEEMLVATDALKGQEGICVYSKKGQAIHKCKAAEYLMLHRFKENANIETVMDLYCEFGYPSYQDFQALLIQRFDFECWNMVQGFASKICEAKKEVDKIVTHMNAFIEPLKKKSRKEAALTIQGSYAQTNRASFCFSLLDGKILGKEAIKKLLYQCLK